MFVFRHNVKAGRLLYRNPLGMPIAVDIGGRSIVLCLSLYPDSPADRVARNGEGHIGTGRFGLVLPACPVDIRLDNISDSPRIAGICGCDGDCNVVSDRKVVFVVSYSRRVDIVNGKIGPSDRRCRGKPRVVRSGNPRLKGSGVRRNGNIY